MKLKVTKFKFTNLLLLSTSILFSLLIGEMVLRIYFESSGHYYAWPPSFKQTFYPDPEILPGISGKTTFISNELGMRGSELREGNKHRILAIGGSTTNCLYLDQNEAWPQKLQNILNTEAGKRSYWVGNVGKSGLTSEHYILHMKYITPQIDSLETVIILSGINDLTKALAKAGLNGRNAIQEENDLFLKAFHLPPEIYNSGAPFFMNSAIYRSVQKVFFRLNYSELLEDKTGSIYKKWRKYRRNAKNILTELPDLTNDLRSYTSNIIRIIDIAEKRNLNLVFLTQPVLWDENLSASERNLLWMGGVGEFQNGESDTYYSVEALRKGMELYNETLIDICESRNIQCIDLASSIPSSSISFYDDCHFNEYGSKLVAELIAEKFLRAK